MGYDVAQVRAQYPALGDYSDADVDRLLAAVAELAGNT